MYTSVKVKTIRSERKKERKKDGVSGRWEKTRHQKKAGRHQEQEKDQMKVKRKERNT